MKDNIKGHNEQVANQYVAKVIAISAVFVAMVQLMNIIGFFRVRPDVMYVACGTSFVLLLIPTFILKVLKINETWLKFVSIACSCLFVFCITVTLNFLVFILFVFPIALASIYFEPKLNLYALGFTIAATIAGRILAYKLQVWQDMNFTSWYNLIIFSIIPVTFMLVTIGIIFHALARNTNRMMGSLMNAEEQEKVFLHVKKLSEKSSEVSAGLSEGMKTLSDVTQSTVMVNEEITNKQRDNIVKAENSAQVVLSATQEMSDKIQLISSNTKHIEKSTGGIVDIVNEVSNICKDSQESLDEVAASVETGLSSMKQLKKVVESIHEMSDELAQAVQS